MKNIKIVVLLCTILISAIDLSGKEIPMFVIKGRTKFTNKADSSVNFFVSSQPFIRNEQQYIGDAKMYKVKYDENGQFSTSFRPPSKRFYLQISQLGGQGFGWVDDVLIADAGDQLECVIEKGSIIFSGPESSKMNCQIEILKKKHVPSKKEHALRNNGLYDEYFDLFKKSMDSATYAQLKVLKSYEGKFDIGLYQTLYANCYGLEYNKFRNFHGFDLYNKKMLPAMKRYISRYKEWRPDTYIDEKYILASPLFANYLFEVAKLRATILGGSPRLDSRQKMDQLYVYLQNTYSGKLRDKLLFIFINQYNSNTYAEHITTKIPNLIVEPYYAELAMNKMGRLKINDPFFKFNLTNDRDEKVTLSNLGNKVVYLHFWYTGCPGCVSLSNGLSSVINRFKSDDRVVFMNISIDKKKDRWLKSGIGSGKYTHDSEINLYTDGQGIDHPLIKYYSISSYPRSFLLKNGKIYSAAPPRPSNLNGKDTKATSELISLIDEALK